MAYSRANLASRRFTRILTHVLLGIGLASCGGDDSTTAHGRVSVKFDLGDPEGSPFPSNRFTVADATQNTDRHIQLPKPDCSVRPSDCADIDVINTLDGFSRQPRITVPFTGDIDVASVSRETVFLLHLGNTPASSGTGRKIGPNQIVWDAATKTLAFESDELLDEHARYLLVLTDGLRDASGNKLQAVALDAADDKSGSADYRRELIDALRAVIPGGAKVVAASLFSTQSTGADLAKIMQQIKQSKTVPADFMIGNKGTVRALFPVTGTSMQISVQTGTTPPAFTQVNLRMQALGFIPDSVGQIAYGKFRSPDYRTAGNTIPATGTRSGQPKLQGTHELVFQLFLPTGTMPPGGWPVAIFGHAITDSMYSAPWLTASVLASKGIATLAINAVGHGGGAAGTLHVQGKCICPMTIPAGGRGIDQDGDGAIDASEGLGAVAPRAIIGFRDGLRQTVIDLMQLVRQVEAGMDVDGDGQSDLDPRQIHYVGQSFGGIYGTILLGVEPSIRTGVLNVAGGSITEVARLGSFRSLLADSLAARTPSLTNGTVAAGTGFIENIPLRNLPPLINKVPGALPIQLALEREEWVQQSGNPVSYAHYIRRQPLHGAGAKPVLFQLARGDKTVPNPTTTAILRAGGLAHAAVEFRNDLAYAANPALSTDPHTFLTRLGNAAAEPYAVAAQTQIALFFQSTGATVIDPDGAAPFFEVPPRQPLQESLNFIPEPTQ
jgi:hypothetical protein